MEVKPALGINIKDYSPEILEGRIWRASEKIDGVRRLFYKNSLGFVSCYSRTGMPDRWLGHIIDHLEAPWFPDDMVYDCELVDRELYFSNADSFILRAETIGKANQQSFKNKQDLMAICFDMVRPGGDDRTGSERTVLLYHTFMGSKNEDPMIRVPIYDNINGADMGRISALMKNVTDKNGEGLMLMALDTIYIPGRSKNLVKVKRMDEFVGTIIDIEMGKEDTKIEGGVAALICQVDGCTVPVRVGTGFSQEQRREFASRYWIGTAIEIESFGKTKNKYGDTSLSIPVFKDILPFR